MAQVRDRLITQEEAQKLVRRMVHKGTMNYIIRDELLKRGFSVYEANHIIREVRQSDEDTPEQRISPEIMEIGLTIITVIIIIMFLFLLIAPVQ